MGLPPISLLAKDTMQRGESSTPNANNPRGRFVTLELFIIDTFTEIGADGVERPIDRADEVGGAGTYAIIGARMFLPPDRLGMVIDYTPDTLPQRMIDTLTGYGEGIFKLRLRADGEPTCRAVNRYQGQLRIFEYLTDPLHLTPSSLAGTTLDIPPPAMLHIVSYPERTFKILGEMQGLVARGWRPVLLWEPEPPCCVPENLGAFTQIAPHMDVFSPNHTEALALLSIHLPSSSEPADIRSVLSDACQRLAQLRPRLVTIIRASSLGCCYISSPTSASTWPPLVEVEAEVKWVPAYWAPADPESANRVVDPTGAGNAFMGGLGAALYEGKRVDEAVLWGTVAASFTIEQNGLPSLSVGPKGQELWNGEDPTGRVEALRRRMTTLA